MPTLQAIYEHPLKSGRGNLVETGEVRSEGLARDRRFLPHTTDGMFISGRSHPRLVLLTADWDESRLVLRAPGVPDLEIEPRAVASASVQVWKRRFPAWDLGDGPARWLSQFLDDELRLAWLGESQRVLTWDLDRRLTFADAAPLLGIGLGSLDELSRRVGEPLSMRRFRPNLAIEGAEPFEEDSWRRFRVGEVEFLSLDGCSRCEFTTIDPETAERHPANQPVAALEQFRRVDTGIYFGMNLMPLTGGTVRVGDKITVLERRKPLFFGSRRALDDALGRLASRAWPGGEVTLVCSSVRDEAPAVKTFTFHHDHELSWEAGQYVTLRAELPDGMIRRSYTISSAPGGNLEITVKRIEDGTVSRWLHDHLVPGATVAAEAVGGTFTLREHPWDSYLFLGAGSGVTPLVALARFIVEHELPVAVAFHQSARTRADLLFADELNELALRSGGRLVCGFRTTADQGRLDHQGLVKFCSDYRDRRALVCGPAGYRASVRELLAGAGFKVDRRYHEELYGEAALEVPDDAEPGIVTFARRGKEVPSDGRTTLLQLAERSGIDLPSSCRSGDCGTCRVQADGQWLLACHTFPRGDMTVDL